MPHEVQTLPALRAAFQGGARVYVPRVTGPRSGDMAFVRLAGFDEIARLPLDRWGIPTPGEGHAAPAGGGGGGGGGGPREPLDPASVDLVLVPGVAFDVGGARLGHGKGYYGACARRGAGASLHNLRSGGGRRRGPLKPFRPIDSPSRRHRRAQAARAPCRRVLVGATEQGALRRRRRDESPGGGACRPLTRAWCVGARASKRARARLRALRSSRVPPSIAPPRALPPRSLPCPACASRRASPLTASCCLQAASRWRRTTCAWTCSRRPRGSSTAARRRLRPR